MPQKYLVVCNCVFQDNDVAFHIKELRSEFVNLLATCKLSP